MGACACQYVSMWVCCSCMHLYECLFVCLYMNELQVHAMLYIIIECAQLEPILMY